MAIAGKVINNSKTRQSIRFIKTGKDTHGQLLEMETVYLPFSKEPTPHYHPAQQEDFVVLQGELTVRLNNQVLLLKQGDVLHIPPGVRHAMWNNSGKTTIVNWQVRPALNTEHLLETTFGLAADGKTNDEGMPGLLQVALIANRFSDVFRLAKPPFVVQKIVFVILSPVAFLLGHRPVYKRYID